MISGFSTCIKFGLPLQEMAQRAGETDIANLAWLASEPVQRALALSLESSEASSLPFERAFAEIKRSEAPRLCHCATASRNQILRQFLRKREGLLAQALSTAAALRRTSATNLQSLAWEFRPDLADGRRDVGNEMRQYIQANEPWMIEEIQRRKAQAIFAVGRASSVRTPVTAASWTKWFDDNDMSFREKMKCARSTGAS